MKAQGYHVESVYVYQDKESAILLETNGMKSVDKGSHHLKIKCFFITDKVKDKELEVLYCPTGDMTADFYTKPLQGALFFKHRSDMPKYKKVYTEYKLSLKG